MTKRASTLPGPVVHPIIQLAVETLILNECSSLHRVNVIVTPRRWPVIHKK